MYVTYLVRRFQSFASLEQQTRPPRFGDGRAQHMYILRKKPNCRDALSSRLFARLWGALPSSSVHWVLPVSLFRLV